LAAIARWDHTARLIDLETLEEVQRLEGHHGNVNAVAFAADDALVFTGSYDGTIRAWAVATGAERGVVLDHGWGVNAVLTLGDRLVFGGLDGTLARLSIDGGEAHALAERDSPVLSLA